MKNVLNINIKKNVQMKQVVILMFIAILSCVELYSRDNDSLYFGMTKEEDRKLSEFINQYEERGYYNDEALSYIKGWYQGLRNEIHNKQFFYDFFDYDLIKLMSLGELIDKLTKMYGEVFEYKISYFPDENIYWGTISFCECHQSYYIFSFFINGIQINNKKEKLEMDMLYYIAEYDIVAHKHEYKSFIQKVKKRIDGYPDTEHWQSNKQNSEELLKLLQEKCGNEEMK
jgi:hypothetical protein